MWYAVRDILFYSLLLYLSRLSPLSLHSVFHTDLAPPPVTQGAHLFLLGHQTLAISLHGQCSTCNNDHGGASTLIVNINLQEFYNYTISVSYICKQLGFLFLTSCG